MQKMSNKCFFNVKKNGIKKIKNTKVGEIKMALILTEEQKNEVKDFINWSNYSFSIDEVLEEYEKFKEGVYVSHSFKQVFFKFNTIFVKN